jgi:hypothetical protein
MIFMNVDQRASVMPSPSWTGIIGRPIYAQGPPVFWQISSTTNWNCRCWLSFPCPRNM